MAYSFDGTNKVITVTAVSTVDVADMYSKWKEWAQTGDNFFYLHAFRTFGGDATVTGQRAPAYFFLVNGWRVHIDAIDVVFATNLYTDEGTEPVITFNGATATIKNSDAPIVTGGGAIDPATIAAAVWAYNTRELTSASSSGLTQAEQDQLFAIATQAELQTMLDASEANILADIAIAQADLTDILDAEIGNWKIASNQMIFYRRDGVTELARFNLLDAQGSPSEEAVFERQRL